MTTTTLLRLSAAALLMAASLRAQDEFLDQVDDALTFSADQNQIRTRISGTLDLENYTFQQTPPGFIVSSGTDLFQPRLSLFLDSQLGPYVYVFAQSRVDRGFDPSNQDIRIRLDEYAVRITPWLDGIFNLQLGKFASVVGNWNPRHLSWDNPFITAPLPYEYLTGVWDVARPPSANVLAAWARVGARPSTVFPIESRSLPILWGPSYATGASVSGAIGRFDYAAEVKNADLASRPQQWDPGRLGWAYPTESARFGYRPDDKWNFGVSASTGSFLLPNARFNIPAGYGLGNYRETVLGQDIGYSWRNWQFWSEVYAARFAIPKIGNADTLAYYLETRWKLTERVFASVRWNQERFGTIHNGATKTRWGSDAWRIDAGPTFRFNAHMQLKLQYSYLRQDLSIDSTNQLLAAQFTLRF